MEVLHIAEAFGGGIVEFVYQLIVNMPQENHTLIYSEREIKIEDIKAKFPKEVTFIEWEHAARELSPKQDLMAYQSLRKILKNRHFDVIHLHSSKAGFIGRIVTRSLDFKNVIYTPNGAPFLRKDIGLIKRGLFILLEYLAAKINGKVICSSKSESEAYKKNFIKSIYINNGINTPPSTSEPRKNPSFFTICTVGRVCFQKNPVLFNNIAKHFEESDNVKFTWVGEGELEHTLTASNIEITGWLTKEEVIRRVGQADLYLSTALWEGLPFAVLEAMALNKPLLLTRAIGNLDLVNGKNGFLFTNEVEAISHISYLINNKDCLTQFAKESGKFFNLEFNAQKMVKKYLIHYKKSL